MYTSPTTYTHTQTHTYTHTPGRLIGAISCPVGIDGGNRNAPGNCGEGMDRGKGGNMYCELKCTS